MKDIYNKKLQTLLYVLCLVLMPFVLTFYQYQRNIEYLAFWHILVLAGAISLLLSAIFFISLVVLKSSIGAFTFTCFHFLCFLLLGNLYSQVLVWFETLIMSAGNSPIRILLFILLFGFVLIVAIIAALFVKVKKSKAFSQRLKDIFKKRKAAIIATSIIFALLLVTLVFMYFHENMNRDHYALIVFIGLLTFIYSLMYMLFLYKLQDSPKMRLVAPVISIMLGVMLTMSSIQIIIFAAAQETDDLFFKESWSITEPLEEQPNIYWFHVDAMLGFDAMSRFFGDDQEELVDALESRGFWVNRYASFDGRAQSFYAIPALMNPFFYDRVMSWELDPAYAESISINDDLLRNPNLRLAPNFTSLRTARERNETILAFNAAGFDTSTVAGFSVYFYPTVDQFYCRSSGYVFYSPMDSIEESLGFINDIANLQNLFDLSHELFPLFPHSMSRGGIFNTRDMFSSMLAERFTRAGVEQRVDIFEDLGLSEAARSHLNRYNITANSLLDIFERPEPRFVTLMTSPHHTNWVFDEHGNYNPENAVNNPSRYAAHHTFGANVVLKLVDLILEHDPNAVIVWQADHGLHGLGTERIMEYFNCTAEEALAIRHSTASAIRLPNMGDDGILPPETMQILSDPRNISRFLVNNFIGQNYDYIPYEFRQVFRGPEQNFPQD